MERVNLTKLVNDVLHRPSAEGYPLYTRTNIKSNDEVAKSEKWIKASNGTYNSPTNIKKIFVTTKGVMVETFTPYIKGGKPTSAGNWRVTPFESDVDIMKAYAELDKNYLFIGDVFSALFKKWKVSNVEEIYIDPVYMCNLTFSESTIGIFNKYRSGERVFAQTPALAQLLVDNSCQEFNSNLSMNKLPRIKCIGLIDKLDLVIANPECFRGSTGVDAVKNYKDIWVSHPKNMEIIKGISRFTVVGKVGKQQEINTTFACRPETYKFDQVCLAPFIEKYKKAAENQKDDLEIFFEKVKQSKGEKIMLEIARGLILSHPEDADKIKKIVKL